ncbi:MAG: TetR family transcriptional regulator [Rhodoplanes sp.]
MIFADERPPGVEGDRGRPLGRGPPRRPAGFGAPGYGGARGRSRSGARGRNGGARPQFRSGRPGRSLGARRQLRSGIRGRSAGARGPQRRALAKAPHRSFRGFAPVAPRPLVSRSDSPASGAASPSAPDGPPRRKRAEKSQARREAILAAALDEFTERGFALTRIDDVARRAGVGKGTIYLHFKDKEALFQQLVITMLGPVVAQLARLPDVDEPVRSVLERVFALFATEVYGTKRPEVLRLVLAEGPRFPHLAEFYYRHVVEPATTMLRRLLDRACARGEIRQERLSQFPQLVVAPALVAIIWRGLFDRFEPLDMAGLMRAHLDLLFAPGDGP